MRSKNELKIFRKTSIEYLNRLYKKSVTYILDKNTWISTESDTYGESKILLHTRKSIKKLGNDLNIFKFPTIGGLKIIYHKGMGLFDKLQYEQHLALISDENYLLRDLSSSQQHADDKELKIFKLPTIDKLEYLYFKKNEK